MEHVAETSRRTEQPQPSDSCESFAKELCSCVSFLGGSLQILLGLIYKASPAPTTVLGSPPKQITRPIWKAFSRTLPPPQTTARTRGLAPHAARDGDRGHGRVVEDEGEGQVHPRQLAGSSSARRRSDPSNPRTPSSNVEGLWCLAGLLALLLSHLVSIKMVRTGVHQNGF